MPNIDYNADYHVMYPGSALSGETSPEPMAGGTVSTKVPSNEADITEHTFLPLSTDLETVLFDNSGGDPADRQLVVFSEPMHDLPQAGTTVSGLTIHEINCNHAIVSGTGRLTGKRYTHVQSIIVASDIAPGDDARVKRVENNCLINSLNSVNTAHRVLSYFSVEETSKLKVNTDANRDGFHIFTPGEYWRYLNSFGDNVEGHIEKADITPTALMGYNWELINGFDPQFVGNNFKNSILIAQDADWTVPADVYHLRVALFAGGQGGQGGYDGHQGAGYNLPGEPEIQSSLSNPIWVAYYPNQPVYDGGDAGEPGQAGKILVFDIDVNPGDVLHFTIGAGGVGGARNGNNGTDGTDTTVLIGSTTYSSADGNIIETGYLYLIRNEIYGAPGEVGHKGGAGGATSTKSKLGWQYADGLPGGDVGEWTGGPGGEGIRAKWWAGGPDEDTSYNEAPGGGGGGAAWGANGKDTYYRVYPPATFTNNPEFYNGTELSIRVAYGGDGASAVQPTTPLYGCGGGGGNGGGSGGNAGGGRITNHFNGDEFVSPYVTLGPGGNPGLGSQGGNGGPGCGIIFW